ncbi:hypothetical protein GLOIN_2v1788170 [Rhizophagus irregularis DAOM 181602=DAOM 197198]|uniref:SAM domain-containing protein n=1 Tax=Rhizophagus irregularis (strain DAOM 181602 / DAOM 197198 / MUCL 43194) TaxID=747089 RepID=A0A2P4P4B5_RHIID|nr:hypothetical protein GLOIN_2v1788170 [Rhizophagus irregularis DAOM 181602=DAOM 197198]POG60228.1 hypothetical protein GLOIN_2v1788170 [Rhizophagus irregularis DAOM 181602=DAOM 197198]|eukprot:XP_025167094.1 hypothetical protein GLOIN_2v1788170 [Rhizophagus irregularis DAOM 181602=DAOM 197198]
MFSQASSPALEDLKKKNLKLEKSYFEILRKEEISGFTFLDITKEDFQSYGLKAGPTITLAKFIEGLSQKLRNYSLLKTLDDLKEILCRNKEINNEDKAFNHCMKDIILKFSNVETMTDVNKKNISGEDATGRVDYVIKSLEDLLCITKGKPRNIKIRYVQNLAQLKSAFQTNKKKWTVNDQAFGNDYFDYIYGIVTTGTE